MKKVMFAALLFIIMFALELNGKEHIQAIESQPLTKAESVTLEENVNVILSDIIDCDINYDASKVVLTSGMKQVIVIYNYKNGKILKYKKAGLYLSDSIKHTNRIPPANPYNQIPMFPIKYLSLEEEKDNLNMLKNEYVNVTYNYDNTISSSAHVYLPVLLKDGNKTAFNTATAVEFDSSLYIKRVIFPNNTLNHYTIAFSFIADQLKKQYYFLNEALGSYHYFKTTDTISVLAVYDENGEYVETALYLDKKFANNEFIFLPYMYNPITTTMNNQHFAMFPCDPNTFYNLTTDDTISLSNPIVDYSEKYEEARNEIKKLGKNKSITKVIEKYMPLSAFKLMNNGENLIICYLNKEDEDNASFIFREYDTNGKFISERTFENKEKLNVQNLLYDKKNNYIVFFIKGEENWTMEKYSW